MGTYIHIWNSQWLKEDHLPLLIPKKGINLVSKLIAPCCDKMCKITKPTVLTTIREPNEGIF
jgi:hypothetical protein